MPSLAVIVRVQQLHLTTPWAMCAGCPGGAGDRGAHRPAQPAATGPAIRPPPAEAPLYMQNESLPRPDATKTPRLRCYGRTRKTVLRRRRPVFDRKFSGAGKPDAGGSAGASLDGDLAVPTELDAGTSHGRLVHLRREERRSSAMSGSRMPARQAGQRGWEGRGPHAGRARAPGAGGQAGNLPAPAPPRPRQLCV